MICFAVLNGTIHVQILSFIIDSAPQSFCHSFVVLSMIRCSKSTRKYAVPVCQVTTVAIETTQLVLSQFKYFYSSKLRIV